MKSNVFVGIDISKKTLDICVKKGNEQSHHQIINTVKAINKFFVRFRDDNLLVGMENTGRYNCPLYEALTDRSMKVFVIPPLHLKKSLGLTRGKNDRIDAQRITEYLQTHWINLRQWKAPSFNLQKLKILLTERNSRIKMIKQLKSVSKEYTMVDRIAKEEKLAKMNDQLIKSIQKQVESIEVKIENLIAEDIELENHNQLLQTIPGIGKILSWHLIVKTDNFHLINTPRKLACYSGIAPFDHQSGTSIRGRTRVSYYADHNLKSLLHLGAMSAIRLNNDLKEYYQRKVSEGKNKMSVLNAVRNKIIHRAFAVMKNNRPYQNYLILS